MHGSRGAMLVVAACALALGGCVGVAEERHAQLDEVGDVEVTTVVCASEAGAEATCPVGNTGQPAGAGEFQLLVAYRVPRDVAVPTSVAAVEGTISLLFSPSFTAELERLAPVAPGANRQWVGYISPGFEIGLLGGDRAATLTSRFGLVRAASGAPWGGPFAYRTVVGFREADPEPARPVTCGETLHARSEDGTVCVDWPAPDELVAEREVPTRDLGILAGAAGSATRGRTGTVPFTVAYRGNTGGPEFTLRASTTVPGGSATAAALTTAPAATGESVIPVTVAVPASTMPGDYEVALTATLPTGQARTAVGRLRVTGPMPADRQPPEVHVALPHRPRLARVRKFGLRPEVSCSEPCRLSAQLRTTRGAVLVGGYAERRPHAGRRRLRVRLRAAALPRLRRYRSSALTLRVVAADARGNRRVRVLALRLRR